MHKNFCKLTSPPLYRKFLGTQHPPTPSALPCCTQLLRPTRQVRKTWAESMAFAWSLCSQSLCDRQSSTPKGGEGRGRKAPKRGITKKKLFPVVFGRDSGFNCMAKPRVALQR